MICATYFSPFLYTPIKPVVVLGFPRFFWFVADEDEEDDIDDDDDDDESTQKKRGKPNPTTGLIGVRKAGEKYVARITIDGTLHYIGCFKTKEAAGVAYDLFVVDKSNEKVTYALNNPTRHIKNKNNKKG